MAEITSSYPPSLLGVPAQCTQHFTEFSHSPAHRDTRVSIYSQGEGEGTGGSKYDAESEDHM